MVNADPFSIVMLLVDSWRWGVTKVTFILATVNSELYYTRQLPFLEPVPDNLHAKRLQIKQQ